MNAKGSRQNSKMKDATKIMSESVSDELEKASQKMTESITSFVSKATDQLQLMSNGSPPSHMIYMNTSDSILVASSSNNAISVDQQHQSTSNSSSRYNITATTNPSGAPHLAQSSNSDALPQTQTKPSQVQRMIAQNSVVGQSSAMRSPQVLTCDLKSLFECPICFDYALPPIYQCQNGHLVCEGCSRKITNCPTCRVPIKEPSIRNLQLDRLAITFQFPCKYNFNGCQWKSYHFKKRQHEEHCNFMSYSCPCPGSSCKWTGLLDQVMPHLRENHKSITTLNGEDIVFLATDINLKGAVDWVMIQSCFDHQFLLILEKQELRNGHQQFFAIVQLIGSQREADRFRYKLELSSSEVEGRRLQWEAKPKSILEGTQAAISNYDCLVFDARTAKHFLSPKRKDKESISSEGSGENLGINVTIELIY